MGGTNVTVMTARRFNDADVEAQEPYEYTEVSGFDNLLLHLRVLFGPGSNVLALTFKTGMYRRADCMSTIATVNLGATDNTIVPLALGKDGEADSQLGNWLSVSWVATGACVVEIKGVGR